MSTVGDQESFLLSSLCKLAPLATSSQAVSKGQFPIDQCAGDQPANRQEELYDVTIKAEVLEEVDHPVFGVEAKRGVGQ